MVRRTPQQFRIAMKLLTLILLSSVTSFAQLQSGISINSTQIFEKAKNTLSNFRFNYYAKYLGPSLSNDMQSGSTFNRFSTGQDFMDNDTDYKDSHQMFQSFALGYKITNNATVSYSYTFQDNLNEGIEYTDSVTGQSSTRAAERSYNNQRSGLFLTSLYSNSIFFVNSGFFYELPTTETSKDSDMQYGLGIQPTVGFFTTTPGLSLGLNASIERYFYPDDQFIPEWCSFNCDDVTNQVRRQKLIASVSPYVNYMLTDKTTLRSTLVFDWDQDGDSNSLRSNLDDIATIGADYRVLNNLTVGAGVEASLVDTSLKKTAVVGSLNVNI